MKKLFVIVFYLVFTEVVFPCSCFHPPTYCETMQTESSDLLVVGYKITDLYHGMSIKIAQVLDGVEIRDTITVWGDNGILCRHFTSIFAVNDTLVFALHNCDLSVSTIEQSDHYQISNCGVYYLNYNNGQVIGSIDNGVNSQSLSNFIQLHNSCSNTTSTDNKTPSFTLYPNPTNNLITLNIEGYDGLINIEVYDLTGKLLKTSNNTTVLMQEYAKGIYVLKVAYGDRTKELKVVKD